VVCEIFIEIFIDKKMGDFVFENKERSKNSHKVKEIRFKVLLASNAHPSPCSGLWRSREM
jgi:hypothetical protein